MEEAGSRATEIDRGSERIPQVLKMAVERMIGKIERAGGATPGAWRGEKQHS